MSTALVLPFASISAADLPLVGGKGANLGELSRAGLPVPGGFCVSTRAYHDFAGRVPGLDAQLAALGEMAADDIDAARARGERIRAVFEATPVPEALRSAVLDAWEAAEGPRWSWAVRSSATAEDLPGASFAGQQDTYLNVRGAEALLDRVRACWASLFTERAILYRAKNGFDHRQVALSVVVQRMVLPEAAGIAFTADPVSGNRKILSIDAGFGLGEALVSGLVNADLYRVDRRHRRILERKIGDKELAILPLPAGGTERVSLPPEKRGAAVLDDARILALAALCERAEAHFGGPQDLEWALAGGELFLLQARPITSLFPLPAPAPTDGLVHVHISFGHLQVMTDALSPMGRSVWEHFVPFGREDPALGPSRLTREAGGRLYVDVSAVLHHPVGGRLIAAGAKNAEALVAAALAELRTRPDFAESDGLRMSTPALAGFLGFVMPKVFASLFLRDPVAVRAEVIRSLEALLDSVRAQCARGEGAARVREIRLAVSRLLRTAIPKVLAIMAAMPARALLERIMRGRVPKATLDALVRGLDGNVTTEMDLAVGDLADLARGHAALTEALEGGRLDGWEALEGGPAFQAAFDAFLVRYGMRGPGEIDLARPRYRDRPGTLLQVIVGNLRTGTAGAHRAHFAELARLGAAAVDEVAEAAPLGLGWLARRLATVYRSHFALREHPKYMLVRCLEVVARVAREEGNALVAAGRLRQGDDVFWLTLPELEEALRDPALPLQDRVDARRAAHERYAPMAPPRVLTSDGESVVARHDHANLPAGALAGTAASAGVVEGIARVILDPSHEVLQAGEILIAPFTDPGWTPLFLNAKGLVMEVGGLMTHGSVVAREYGIPAVVCVPEATRRIRTGDRVRVSGDEGYVLVLPP